jgi:hypothetical protein
LLEDKLRAIAINWDANETSVLNKHISEMIFDALVVGDDHEIVDNLSFFCQKRFLPAGNYGFSITT